MSSLGAPLSSSVVENGDKTFYIQAICDLTDVFPAPFSGLFPSWRVLVS